MTEDERKAALMALVREVPSPTRAELRLQSLAAGAAALTVSLGLFLALGGVRPGGSRDDVLTLVRPAQLVLATAIGAAFIGGVAAWWLVGRGRSMLGRSRGELLLGALAVIASLLAWKLYASSLFPEMTLSWPSRPGVKCIAAGLLIGVGPLAVLLAARRGSDPVHPRTTGAGLGVAAGAVTWLLVDLWCPVAHPGHLLLGHVTPVVLLALAGALAGRRWLGLARR